MIADLGVSLRPVQPGDEEFLYQVYASTRADEMALVDWTAEQKEAFLRMQIGAQTEHYKIHYPNAKYQILEGAGVPIGRLIVERSKEFILIIDIALLPEYRKAGIGTAVIRDLMDEATRVSLPIVLRVEFFNPAIKLYSRLGFLKTREMGVYHEMVWRPSANNS